MIESRNKDTLNTTMTHDGSAVQVRVKNYKPAYNPMHIVDPRKLKNKRVLIQDYQTI